MEKKDLLKAELYSGSCPLVAIQCAEPESLARFLAQQTHFKGTKGKKNGYDANMWFHTAGTVELKTNNNKSPEEKHAGKIDDAITWAMLTQERNVLFIKDWWLVKENNATVALIGDLCSENGSAKRNNNMLVLMGPGVHAQIPESLKVNTTFLTVELPTEDELVGIIEDKVKEIEKLTKKKISLGEENTLKNTAAELRGLTGFQVKALTARCISQHKGLNDQFFRDESQKLVNQIPGITMIRPEHKLSDLGGFGAAIDYMHVLTHEDMPANLAAKMLFFVGPSGTGKTMAAEVFAGIKDWRVFDINIGALMAKWVGETEERVARLLEYMAAPNRYVAVIDEMEKAFAGADTESTGITKRVLGEFLKFQQNRKNVGLIIATANNPITLQESFPEMFRAGRIDQTYMVDIPDEETCAEIIKLKLDKYEITGEVLSTTLFKDFTGAEIEQAIKEYARYKAIGRDAVVMDQFTSAIRPIADKNLTSLRTLYKWAENNCVDATTGEPFKTPESRAMSSIGYTNTPLEPDSGNQDCGTKYMGRVECPADEPIVPLIHHGDSADIRAIIDSPATPPPPPFPKIPPVTEKENDA